VGDNAIKDGCVVVDGEAIAYAGPIEGYAPNGEMEVIDAAGGTILPGFIDCHTHMVGGHDGPLSGCTHLDSVLSAAHHMGMLLDAGFTFIRDMSIYSGALARAVERGEVRGPGVMPGGRVISPTAGHSDSPAGLPVELLQQLNPIGFLADGVEGCLRAARMQFRDGAEFIKICATGGVSSAVDGLDDIQFSDQEIEAICAEAARHGTYAAAHCSNAKGTLQALRNGVMCIEHGIDLDDKCIEIMVRKSIPVVTTLFVSNLVATHPGYPSYIREKGKKAAQRHIKSMLKAREAGIRIAYGTDFTNSPNTPYLGNGMEFQAIANAGFTPIEAIKIGTANGAYVVKRANEIGTLKAGKQADIVVVDGDPLADVSVLGHASHVKLVVRRGRIEKRCL
jgi:imidazolonepropionase-like amidohydrolase